MNALHQQEQELLAGKEQIVDILSRIEEEKASLLYFYWSYTTHFDKVVCVLTLTDISNWFLLFILFAFVQIKIGETIELFKTKDGELRDFLSQHERESEENQVDKQIEPKAALFKQ